MSKLFFHSFVFRKPFSLRQDLFFVLVLFFFLYLLTAHFHCETHFLIFAVQVIKIISRSFSLFVFRKTSNIKTDYKAVYKIFSLQILQMEKYENKNTIGFDLNISPWFEMISFNVYNRHLKAI